MSSFAGFVEAEFDAYAPSKAGSNAYTLGRMRASEKFVGVARSAALAAKDEGLALELRASDTAPSVWNKRSVTDQWVFLWRDEAARKVIEELLDAGRTLAATLHDPTPFYRHAFLALHLDVSSVSVTLKVHGDAWVDVKHLRATVAEAGACEALLGALRGLPEGFTVGVTGGAETAVAGLDAAGLKASVDALRAQDQWWSVTFAIPRAEAIGAGSLLAEALEGGFAALLPVYRLVAWRPDNDLARLDADLVRARAAKEAQDAKFVADEQAWQTAHDAELAKAREAAEARAQERAEAAAPPRFAVMRDVLKDERPARAEKSERGERSEKSERVAPQRTAPPPPQQQQQQKAAAARPVVKAAPKVTVEAAPEAPVAVSVVPTGFVLGAKVKVEAGPFAGRVGTISELDAKVVKVSFGLLAARVERGAVSPVE